MPSSQPRQTGNPDNIIDALYRISMEFCRDKEPEYRQALTADLSSIDPARLATAFNQEIQVYEPPVFHNPIRRGEIEFFAMMSTFWLYRLHQLGNGDAAADITRRYMDHVLAMEPEWLGIVDYAAMKAGTYQSMRANRMTLYFECIEEIAPVVLAVGNLKPLYSHFTRRLLAHLGLNSWELPNDLPDSSLFLFRYSDVWQPHLEPGNI